MSKKVLFTCVGSSDPVRGLHDGGMLHIVRHYLPEKVYIVLSKEMEEMHRKDDRYNKAIQKFCTDFHHKIDVTFLPCKIEDVSDFDAFDDLFHEIAKKIARENPGAEILLNISSGSPQMKITLCLLATDIKFKNITAVQVKTYEKKSNKSDTTTKQNYDMDTEIELNEDNLPGSKKRCSVPKLFYIKKALVLNQVQALLKNYEYSSLKILMDSFGFSKTAPDAVALTEHLILRQCLKTNEAKKAVNGKNFGFDLFPIHNAACMEETEFFLVLQNLSRTGKITEFILRLNPFVIRMQELYLIKKCNFDCNKIKVNEKYDKKHIEKIHREKIKSVNPELLKFIDMNYNPKYEFHDTFPNISLYNQILTYIKGGDAEKGHYMQFFKDCEQLNQERNNSAHMLYGIDESDLEREGMCSGKILNTMQKILQTCHGNECKKEIFDIYDRINNLILSDLSAFVPDDVKSELQKQS